MRPLKNIITEIKTVACKIKKTREGMKYHFRIHVTKNEANNAGTKAVKDCTQILINLGFKDLQITFANDKQLAAGNIFSLLAGLLRMFFKTERGSLILIQYPLLGINRFTGVVCKLLKLKKCTTIGLVHDLDSLRDIGPANTAIEFKNLNSFDHLITHNKFMTQWLKTNNVDTNFVEIKLFDYLTNNADIETKAVQIQDMPKVVFAGSFYKSSFVYELNKVSGAAFNLYGVGFEASKLKGGNVFYKGSFLPEELPSILEGDFGLIWDGNSIEDCAGIYGKYLAYNTPHKTSLYLVAGLPVIVYAKAAIAEFVVENNIGFIVNSLYEINTCLQKISKEKYEQMKQNCKTLSNKLTEGFYLKQAIGKAVHF